MKLRKYLQGGMRQPEERGRSPKRDSPVPIPPSPSRCRLWLYRISAVFLVPLVVLGSIEMVLRLADYGYPTSYFLTTRIQGADFYVPNAKFTARFFSTKQVRSPVPIQVAARKSTNAYRIFVLGESAANGDPDPSYGFSRYLEVLLRDRYPKTDFEVLCVAITGINSHTILPIARECAKHQGDLWLVYMGNNEMVGPFGAETVFGARAPSLGFVRATLAVKTTRIGQLLDSCAEHLKRRSRASSSWGGMRMFINSQLRYDDSARGRACANFEENLEAMLRVAGRTGVPVVLSTVAVNLKDCAPFASMHAPGLGANDEASWNKAYRAGQQREAAGSYSEALALYQTAARIDSKYADLQFCLGRCELALTNYSQARQHFSLATDYDALAFRADSTINRIIRTAAERHQGRGVSFVDAAEALAAASPAGIPGCELFYEHVHFNFHGNYLLALEFAERVSKLLPQTVRASNRGNWAPEEFCRQRLAVTVWDEQRVWQPIFNRITFPPFTAQVNHASFFKLCQAKLEDAKSRMNVQTPAQAQAMYEEALALAPGDILLRANFEQFLEAGGKLPEALAEARRLCKLSPYLPAPYYHAGTILVRQGKIREAEEYFSRAIAIQGDCVEAHNALGMLLAGQQRTAEAAACFARALAADPDNVDAYINLGFLEQRQGKLREAMANYEKAARRQPDGPADSLNRAILLSSLHRSSEAIQCFRILVQQVPGFWQAHFLLGNELAGSGREDEARAEFAAVLRYRPDYARMLPPPPGTSEGKQMNTPAESPGVRRPSYR